MRPLTFTLLILPFVTLTAHAEISNCRINRGDTDMSSRTLSFDMQPYVTATPDTAIGQAEYIGKTHFICSSNNFKNDRMYFRLWGVQNIISMLASSGVKLQVTTDLHGQWEDYVQSKTLDAAHAYINADNSFIIKPKIRLIRSGGPLNSFDTHEFTVGTPLTTNRGSQPPIIINQEFKVSLSGKVNIYCLAPKVSMPAQYVKFGSVSYSNFVNDKKVNSNFSINASLSDCKPGLEVSMKLTTGNGISANRQYVLLDNGLQVEINNLDGSAVYFNTEYNLGTLTEATPKNKEYITKLSRVAGSELKVGEFSKTINVIFTYK